MENSNRYGVSRGGQVIIFDNEEFNCELNVNERFGSKLDARGIYSDTQNRNFVSYCPNYTTRQIMEKIAQVSGMDHDEYDYLLVCVLTHGAVVKGQELLYSKDGLYRPSLLWLPFSNENCPSLENKAKIFIIQACRGEQEIKMSPKIDGELQPTQVLDHDGNSYSVNHNMPDLLIARSTFIGLESYRSQSMGTLYIQTLLEVMRLEELVGTDMQTVLTKVNRVFSQRLPYIDREKKTACLQMPCFTSSLTKKLTLYLNNVLEFTEKD